MNFFYFVGIYLDCYLSFVMVMKMIKKFFQLLIFFYITYGPH